MLNLLCIWHPTMNQQVTRGHKIVAVRCAGASNPHPHPNPPHKNIHKKSVLNACFPTFLLVLTDGLSYRVACPQLKRETSPRTMIDDLFVRFDFAHSIWVCMAARCSWEWGWYPHPYRPFVNCNKYLFCFAAVFFVFVSVFLFDHLSVSLANRDWPK